MFTGFRLPGPELLLAHQMALTPGHTVTVRDPKAICRDCLQPARTEAMACMSKGTWPGKWMSPQSLLMRNTSSRPPHQRCPFAVSSAGLAEPRVETRTESGSRSSHCKYPPGSKVEFEASNDDCHQQFDVLRRLVRFSRTVCTFSAFKIVAMNRICTTSYITRCSSANGVVTSCEESRTFCGSQAGGGN